LFIGLDQSNPRRTSYLSSTDYQVITSLVSTPMRAIYQNGNEGTPLKLPKADLTVVNTNPGYIFEYLFRWNFISSSFKPAEGRNIGFNLQADDSDARPGGQDTSMSPFANPNLWKDPSTWLTATLVPAKTVENPTAGSNPVAGQ